jgi:hypothetical protein
MFAELLGIGKHISLKYARGVCGVVVCVCVCVCVCAHVRACPRHWAKPCSGSVAPHSLTGLEGIALLCLFYLSLCFLSRVQVGPASPTLLICSGRQGTPLPLGPLDQSRAPVGEGPKDD